MTLTPEIDTFQEVNRLPDLIIEDNFLFDAMVNLTGEMASSGMGTTWGEGDHRCSTTSTSSRFVTMVSANAVENAANAIIAAGGTVTVDANLNEGGMALFEMVVLHHRWWLPTKLPPPLSPRPDPNDRA